jgi:hypothetical protein
MGATFRAALPVETAFMLFYEGITGAMKSVWTALLQQHYGPEFDYEHLPTGWASTANAIEKLANLARNTVLVIDDFVPRGG